MKTVASSIVAGNITVLLRAKSAIDFLIVLPERVLGKFSTCATNLNDAIGPIISLINLINSTDILAGDFVTSIIKRN